MDHTNVEIAAVEEAVKNATDAQFRELNDLHLLLGGGGQADPIYA